jgi:hypothetical protein
MKINSHNRQTEIFNNLTPKMFKKPHNWTFNKKQRFR